MGVSPRIGATVTAGCTPGEDPRRTGQKFTRPSESGDPSTAGSRLRPSGVFPGLPPPYPALSFWGRATEEAWEPRRAGRSWIAA